MSDEPANPGPSPAPDVLGLRTQLFVWLTAVYVASLLLANIVGVKLFAFSIDLGRLGTIPVEHTAGMLPFPITFLLTDLLNEYYGKRAARRVVWIAFAMALVAFAIIAGARALPILEVEGTATRESFENVFGASSIMYIASVCAFLVGALLDVFLFRVFKRLTGGRMVWLRATGSTVISQMFDSLIVTFLFFYGIQALLGNETRPLGWVLQTAATGYILKFVIAVAMTPFIYAGRYAMQRWAGLRPV